MSGSLVIRDAHVLTLDDGDREWPRADILIEDGKVGRFRARLNLSFKYEG